MTTIKKYLNPLTGIVTKHLVDLTWPIATVKTYIWQFPLTSIISVYVTPLQHIHWTTLLTRNIIV